MAEYIDRERLKEAFSTDTIHSLQNHDEALFELILMEIDEIPAADVAPVVHGRWDGNLCSACQLPWDELMVSNGDDWGYFDPMPPYCPNCGAKMDGDDHA